MSNNLFVAAKAWDVSNEALDHVNARIHDGAVTPEELHARGDKYVGWLADLFPYIEWKAENILEIGSGTGFIMEAVERKTRFGQQRSIQGLDISESMISAAKQRLKGNPNESLYSFTHYDGVKVPLPDESFDLIYSVAALQHVPKPYVYNLFFEIKRLLKPNGYCVIHLLPFSSLYGQESLYSWRDEISVQVGMIEGPHWHHYYCEEELLAVLKGGTQFQHVQVIGDIFVCMRKTPVTVPSHFDAKAYLKAHRDVARARVDPVQHYEEWGWKEGRHW